MLALPLTGIFGTDFSRFLKRSSPPLQKLVLGPRCSGLEFRELAEYLRMVPSLLHLQLGVDRDPVLIEELFEALTDPSQFLPRLCTLKVLSSFPHSCGPFYQKIFRALSIRSTQLVRVELINPRPFRFSKMNADIRDGFCSLAAEGMNIYIGTQEDNFIYH
ncbi:hypothetical protein B0H12DRAFT_1132364 [Mycena haematopus]|nr:hypothetical protein B0H12DRAFT_1132364 [Mycena haematopus]